MNNNFSRMHISTVVSEFSELPTASRARAFTLIFYNSSRPVDTYFHAHIFARFGFRHVLPLCTLHAVSQSAAYLSAALFPFLQNATHIPWINSIKTEFHCAQCFFIICALFT